jgi:hypothetical protein
MIHWARGSKQDSNFVKWNFGLKTYDKVSWDFLFMATKRLWMASKYIEMVFFIFQDVGWTIYCNMTLTFPYIIRLWPKCTFGLFFIMWKVLKRTCKQVVSNGEIQVIHMLKRDKKYNPSSIYECHFFYLGWKWKEWWHGYCPFQKKSIDFKVEVELAKKHGILV